MNKLLLSILISLLFYSSKAQENRYSTWGFGFGVLYDDLNIGIENSDTLNSIKHESKPGMNVYVSFNKPLNKSFQLRIGLGFTFTNNDLQYNFVDTIYNFNNLYGGLCLPINFVIKPLKNKDYEFLMKSQLDFVLMNGGYLRGKRFAQSIGVGIGKEFHFKPINIAVDIIYNYGLTNYYKETIDFHQKKIYGVNSLKQNIFEISFCFKM